MEKYEPYINYVQSANTLFHFMDKFKYLMDILKNRKIAPRYCIENVEYLNINVVGQEFKKIAVLQKCFCDIPLHKLTDTFEVHGVGDNFNQLTDIEKFELEKKNSHTDYYGKYGIAFSKKWGENKGLQPVQYINATSSYVTEFSKTLYSLISATDMPDKYADDTLQRLAYMKPLRGTMSRLFKRKNELKIEQIELKKNFHDEREWRYVPSTDILAELKLSGIIANPNLLESNNGVVHIFNRNFNSEHYRKLCLEFDCDDVRYIIVPTNQMRKEIIDNILSIPFANKQEKQERYILISKILVLEEIRSDY